MEALTLLGVSKTFGAIRALENISVQIQVGDALGLIGCNGAGKSTLIRMITGQLPPTTGKIVVSGKAVVGEALDIKKIIGFVPDEDNIIGKVTPVEF